MKIKYKNEVCTNNSLSAFIKRCKTRELLIKNIEQLQKDIIDYKKKYIENKK